MAVARIPNSSGFQAKRGAQLEFRAVNNDFFIKNAYSMNGKQYDISYGTTSAGIETLKKMNPTALVQTLQEQMRACLNATRTFESPEKIRFSVENGRIYASGQGKIIDISSNSDSVTRKTMQVMMRNLCSDRGLLQSSDTTVKRPQPPSSTPPPVLASKTRISLFSEGMQKTMLESEGYMLFGGFITGPICIVLGFVELVLNLISAIFCDSQNRSEYLKGALEGLEHFGLGIYATILSCTVGWLALLGLLTQFVTNITG